MRACSCIATIAHALWRLDLDLDLVSDLGLLVRTYVLTNTVILKFLCQSSRVLRKANPVNYSRKWFLPIFVKLDGRAQRPLAEPERGQAVGHMTALGRTRNFAEKGGEGR